MPKAATGKTRTGKSATKKQTTQAARNRATAARAGRKKTAARAAARKRTRRVPEPSAVRTTAVLIKGAAKAAVAAVTQKSLAGEPDALTLLENDHRRLEALFAEGEALTSRAVKSRTRILDTLSAELNVHELIEEKLLYPALEPYREAHDIVLEGVQEHHVADLLLSELRKLARSDEQWGAKFKVLKENIEHHIDEEEKKMFRIARGVMPAEDLLALGRRMARLKADSRDRPRR